MQAAYGDRQPDLPVGNLLNNGNQIFKRND